MKPPPKQRLDNESVHGAYQTHRVALERFLTGVLKDTNLVADVLQISFTRLIEKGGQVKQESLKAWLFRVAYNEAMLIHRKQKVDRKAKDVMAWTLGRADVENEGFAALSKKERAEQVRAVLGQLPVEQREIVQLRIRDGLKFVEIADQLKIPLGTVLTRMRSGLKKIKDQLENQDVE